MHRSKKYDAVIFDLDGTLTVPTLDFSAIRKELNIPTGDIVVEISKLPPYKQAESWAIIERHEEVAMLRQTLQTGALKILKECRSHGILLGLVTRNSMKSVEFFTKKYSISFDGVVTRETPPLKPHPAPIQRLLSLWNIPSSRALVVGDYRHDIQAGIAAGTQTCFFQNKNTPFSGEGADFVIHSFNELFDIIFS